MASKNHTLFWGSSYDRGLDNLLFIWPDIRQAFPDAELHVAYGWDLFDKAAAGNPERQAWKKSVVQLLKQPGITEYGRVSKLQLSGIRKRCGIWAYPTNFQEINCITALETQADGLVPVTMALAALKETAKHGILVEGDIKDVETQQKYLKELLDLMGDEKRWKKMSNKCRKFTNTYHWMTVANRWIEYFKEPISNPKVSVLTPTIREGWFNLMAENLSKQTYKNFEWIIIDDYKEDRSKIAEKYAKKYNLTIHYLRGVKAYSPSAYPRKCGLVAANNLGWKKATGELLVWLQDFIVIPENGIEQLVDIYRHNPDALIAPTDIYYDCLTPVMDDKEDWWLGKTDILTKETWRNVRNKYLGMRESDNPFDWEANYGAIPKKILDELNGFWQFMDDGLGHDNLEICYRAMKLGYRLIVDDTNVAKCNNLWPFIGGTSQNITSRERMLNPPRWEWLKLKTENGELPIRRDEKLDDSIKLYFKVPEDVEDKDCSEWITQHTDEIVRGWIKNAV